MAKTFKYTGGNDTITGYNGGDIIKISAKKISGYSFDGNDLIFTIGGGTLTLKDMKGRAITIKNSSGKTTTKIYGTGYTAQDVIKNLVAAWNKTQLTGTAKLDESIRLCSHFKSIQDVINHMVADCRAAGDADTFLKKYCGIILGNDDTGAITGWDAGGLIVKTAKDIIPETTTLEQLDDYTNASFVRENVTINISSTGDSLTADGKKVFDGIYNWWAEGALKLIEESYGVEFSTGNEINIALTPSASYWGQTVGDSVKINLGDTRFNGDDDYQGNGVDRTIAHEFTHVAQNFFMGQFPRFLEEGFADLTCGRDDKKTSVIKKLAGNADTLKKYLDLSKGGTGNANYYAAGFMFYRYLAKQAADAYNSSSSYAWTDNLLIKGTSKANFLTGSGNNSSILAGAGNDTLTAYGNNMKVFGGAGNDTILTNGNAIKASGGSGNDYIKNRGDNSTLAGYSGNDFIINGGYWENERGGQNVSINAGSGNDTLISHGFNSVLDGNTGNDLIFNGYRYYEPWDYFYNANDDTFKGNNSTILGGSGNDSIYNLGDNVLIDTGTGKNLVDNGSSTCVGGSNVTINGGSSNDTITNYGGFFVTINAGAGNDCIKNTYTVDYRNYNQETKTYETVETIIPEHVTISGGNGNDTLWGGAGADTFTYTAGDGSDIIYGFDDKDTLTIDGLNFTASYSKKKAALALKFDGGSITFKDFTASTFHIDNDAYKISGSKFKKVT